MKILFYPLIDHSLINMPLQLCDYMNDCVFHGLRSLLGENAIDFYHMSHMYNTYEKKKELYGNGFTIFGKLPDIVIDRNDLENKIKNKYFDQIIVGIHNNSFRSIEDNVEKLKQLKQYGNTLKIIDGNDHTDIYNELTKFGPLFKRELIQSQDNVFPISFAIPKEYIVDSFDINIKQKELPNIIPQEGGKPFWVYTDENQYRTEYQQSIFAFTRKKGGWDCLRHYEIIGNGSLPFFQNIEECPSLTLTTLPKYLLYDIQKIYLQNHIRDIELLISIGNELIQYAKKYLTTEFLAQRILFK